MVREYWAEGIHHPDGEELVPPDRRYYLKAGEVERFWFENVFSVYAEAVNRYTQRLLYLYWVYYLYTFKLGGTIQ